MLRIKGKRCHVTVLVHGLRPITNLVPRVFALGKQTGPGGRWSRDLLKSSRFLISVVLSILFIYLFSFAN